MRTSRLALGRAMCNTLLAALIFSAGPAAAEIEVTADRITQADGSYWLHLTLWNCSAAPLKVDGAFAPWGEHAITLALFGADPMPTRFWPQQIIPEEVRPPVVQLAPGGHTEGKVPLRFPPFGSQENTTKGPFVLFWSYNTDLLGERPARQVSGTINIGIAGDQKRAKGSPCVAEVK
jgi:hypothetical protein